MASLLDKMPKDTDVVEVSPQEIYEHWIKIEQGHNPLPNQTQSASQIDTWRNARPGSWVGCSFAQMQGWLAEGFYPEGELPEIDYGDYEVKRRKLHFWEEGELQVDLALSGHDYPFLEWDQRESKEGLKIVADISCVASTSSKTLADYQAGVLQIIEAAEMCGRAPEVEVVINATHPYEGASGGWADRQGNMLLTIPIKDSLHANDTVAWRAFFSAGGLRVLGFLAMMIAAERLGKQINSGFGGSVLGSQWIIDYEQDTGTLSILPPISPQSFPEDKLKEAVKKAGLSR